MGKGKGKAKVIVKNYRGEVRSEELFLEIMKLYMEKDIGGKEGEGNVFDWK